MKRIFSILILACTYLIPMFSQSNIHSKIDTNYEKSIAVVDARPFPVVNKAFKGSLNQIVNEKVLLVPVSSDKDMNFQYKTIQKSDNNQSFDNKSKITTIRYIPRNYQIKIPETGSPLLIKKL
jgi:hypothetical protein